MILIPCFSEVTIPTATPGPVVALVHPGGSQIGLFFFRGLDVVGPPGSPTRLRLARHTSKAAGGTTNSVYSFLDNAPVAFAEVRSGAVSWPVGSATLAAAAFAESRASGGGVVAPTGNATAGALTIGPDHSLVIETVEPDTRGDVVLRLFWGEQRPSLPHATVAELPAYPAYTAGAYFPVPPGWTSITFLVTYAAHASSTGGRPRWRCSASDGANDYPLLVLDDAIDLSDATIGKRNVHRGDEQWPTTIAANDVVRFPISYRIPPGAPRIRLDVAEAGDATNRGSAAVLITGE